MKIEEMTAECPTGHFIKWDGCGFVYKDSGEDRRTGEESRREPGLHCHGCDRIYELSRLNFQVRGPQYS